MFSCLPTAGDMLFGKSSNKYLANPYVLKSLGDVFIGSCRPNHLPAHAHN